MDGRRAEERREKREIEGKTDEQTDRASGARRLVHKARYLGHSGGPAPTPSPASGLSRRWVTPSQSGVQVSWGV